MAAITAAAAVMTTQTLVPEPDTPPPPPLGQPTPWQEDEATPLVAASEVAMTTRTTVARPRQAKTMTRRRLFLTAMVLMLDPAAGGGKR
jgi:hypothetical protein